MTEETIFTAALEKQSPTERSAFLDEACGGDAALRQRLDALIEAHEQAADFLEKPAAEQIAAGISPSTNHTERIDAVKPAVEGITETPADPVAAETRAAPPGEGENAQSLDFLAPPEKPGALGRLGHYDVLAVIGRGGMGVVLKAFDEELQRVVAIKVMAPQLAATATARKRFRREAQAAAAVRDEHVIDIHAVNEVNGLPYLVMEYVNGVSLQEQLDQSGPLELKEILRIGMQTATGLAKAHAQGLIHRDIKPANILLENGVQRVKLTDFGLARAVDDASLTQSGVIAGTPQYMAPEQARGEAVDHRADLFSLGSVLYAMSTGRPPFRASSVMATLKRVSEDMPRPVREMNPEIPDWLAAIIDKLQAKEPAQRFRSAQEVADLLGRHLSHLQQPATVPLPPPVTRPSPPQSRKRSHALPWVLAAVAVVGLSCCVLAVPVIWMFGWIVVRPALPPDLPPVSEERIGPVVDEMGTRAVEAPPAIARVRRFAPPKDVPITQDGVTATADGWKIENTGFQQRTVRLFEVRDLDVKGCRLVFRVRMRTETKEKLENRRVFTRVEMAFRPKVTIKKSLTGDTVTEKSWNALARRGNTAWAQEEAATTCLSQPDAIALNLLVEGIGAIWIKDVELVALPLAAEAGGERPAKPFIILPRANGAERTFATLAAAAAAARSGDTIEVRGDGPYACEPITLAGKALTIRAGKGCQPVVQPKDGKLADPMLETDAPLVLEGLTLQCWEPRQAKEGHPERNSLLLLWKAPLHAAHCRFRAKTSCVAVWASESPVCDLRHCEIGGPELHAGVDWMTPSKGRLLLENCILVAGSHGLVIHQKWATGKGCTVQLRGNTLSAYLLLDYWLWTPFKDVSSYWFPLARNMGLHESVRMVPIQIDARDNLLDTQAYVLDFMQIDQTKPLSAKDAAAALPRLISWGDRRNVYPAQPHPFLRLSAANCGEVLRTPVSPPDVATAADWEGYWGSKDTDSIHGKFQYQGGDVRLRGKSNPEQILASDFRLTAGSAGKEAGKDGRDLGADVDLVGPGPPYERWKKMPAYQQWLKDTEPVRGGKP
ncbi:MAG TPA: serine/threonine-protein kinase [Gemmataceae bacterium]|jgi:hypothetical protein